MEKTNYIIHLNSTFGKICEDTRLTPFHVSLYFSLFQYWNMAKFRNPISISRDEMMRASKIGSVNTYIRCIKELDAWQYIRYVPSFNPQKGSQVHLYTFNKATNKTPDNGNDISADNSTKKASGKAHEKQLSPSINNSNSTNKTNKIKKHEPTRRKNTKKFIDAGTQSDESKNEKIPRAGLREIQDYFARKDWPAIEAEKFFNYYQSNGWLVGGKTPMRSWKACASNWILNTQNFKNGKEKPAAGKLNASTGKNYSEPL